jgi:rhamnosyltransferase
MVFMKRAVVFAHYDKQNIIDDYVVYYLKALKEISDEIIFVSCCESLDTGKIDDIVSKTIAEKHDEYDFGSYKRGYLYLKERLNEFDELVFVNDSCYGPFFPLKNVFDEMDKKDCDFWGITKNNFGYKKSRFKFFVKRPHIQSYFISFKKNVFTSKIFNNFMQSITVQKSKRDIISKYEIGLSELLYENYFKYDVYINAFENINNSAILKWRQLINDYKMPFLKCSVPRLLNREMTTADGWENIILFEYPKHLIENNIKRLNLGKKNKKSYSAETKRKFFDFIADKPFLIKKIITKIVFLVFPFIKD